MLSARPRADDAGRIAPDEAEIPRAASRDAVLGRVAPADVETTSAAASDALRLYSVPPSEAEAEIPRAASSAADAGRVACAEAEIESPASSCAVRDLVLDADVTVVRSALSAALLL